MFFTIKIANFNIRQISGYLMLWKNFILIILFEAVKLKSFGSLEIATKLSSSPFSSKRKKNYWGKPWISYVAETLLSAPESILEMQVDNELFEAWLSRIIHLSSETHKPCFLNFKTEKPGIQKH